MSADIVQTLMVSSLCYPLLVYVILLEFILLFGRNLFFVTTLTAIWNYTQVATTHVQGDLM